MSTSPSSLGTENAYSFCSLDISKSFDTLGNEQRLFHPFLTTVFVVAIWKGLKKASIKTPIKNFFRNS